jgi:hypothetical protein
MRIAGFFATARLGLDSVLRALPDYVPVGRASE